MKLRVRFALNALSPPPIATLLTLSFFSMIEGPTSLVPAISMLPWGVCWGYMIAGLPSILHAWWLNYRYKAGLSPRSGRAVVHSMLSGTISGACLAMVSAILERNINEGAIIMILLGYVTGALNGLLQFLIHDEPLQRE